MTSWAPHGEADAVPLEVLLFSQDPLARLIVSPDGVVSAANEYAALLFQRTREDMIGLTLDLLLPSYAVLSEAGEVSAFKVRPPDATPGVTSAGLVIPLHVESTSFTSGQGRYWSLAIRTRPQEEDKGHLTDPLTGLLNRRGMEQKGVELLERMRAGKHRAFALFVDLDGFKGVNDKYGHHVGDATLGAVAQRLRSALGPGALIGRVGGDEFLVLLHGESQGRSDVAVIASRVVQAVESMEQVQGNRTDISASVGIASFPKDGDTYDRVVTLADFAMFSLKKESRRGQVRFFDHQVKDLVDQQELLEAELRHAMRENEFQVHYQMQYDLATAMPVGMEALVRWQSPSRGLVSPALFLPAMERYGMMNELDAYVLNKANHDMTILRQWAPKGFQVSVNISPELFSQPGFPSAVLEVLRRHDLPPEFLKLEIVESKALETDAVTRANFDLLKQAGVKFAMDDFGTGYSSIAQMQAFEFDQLKLDRSFVVGIEKSERQAAVVETIIQVARRLKMDVIAEGVESPDEVKVLATIGCVKIQGFLMARPAPFGDNLDILKNAENTARKNLRNVERAAKRPARAQRST